MPATLEDEEINLKELVDRGVKLYRETLPLKKKLEELEMIKSILREEAKGRDHDFFGTGGNIARVEQKPDAICRNIPDDEVEWFIKVAGPHLPEIVTLSLSKGGEKSVELNLLKIFAKKLAFTVMRKFTLEVTPWVRFS